MDVLISHGPPIQLFDEGGSRVEWSPQIVCTDIGKRSLLAVLCLPKSWPLRPGTIPTPLAGAPGSPALRGPVLQLARRIRRRPAHATISEMKQKQGTAAEHHAGYSANRKVRSFLG